MSKEDPVSVSKEGRGVVFTNFIFLCFMLFILAFNAVQLEEYLGEYAVINVLSLLIILFLINTYIKVKNLKCKNCNSNVFYKGWNKFAVPPNCRQCGRVFK